MRLVAGTLPSYHPVSSRDGGHVRYLPLLPLPLTQAGGDRIISNITLALFEDSGWYLPDYA